MSKVITKKRKKDNQGQSPKSPSSPESSASSLQEELLAVRHKARYMNQAYKMSLPLGLTSMKDLDSLIDEAIYSPYFDVTTTTASDKCNGKGTKRLASLQHGEQ